MFEFPAGDSASLIRSLSFSLPAIAKPGISTTIAGDIDVTDIIKTSDIQQYNGSLTIFPCAEGVTFFIVKKPLAINVEKYNAIK